MIVQLGTWEIPTELIALYVTVLAGLVAAWRSRRTLQEAWQTVGVPARWGLVTVLVAHAAIALLWVPPGPLEPNNHGHDRYLTVRDVGLLDRWDGEVVHGAGWFVVVRPLWHLLAGQVSPMTINVGLVLIGLAAFGLAVRMATEDDGTAVLATAVLALLPTELRSSPTVSMFGVGQAGIAVAWLAVELHLRDRAPASLWLAASATLVSMQTHLEMLALTPVAVFAWLTGRRPAWWTDLLRRPAWIGVVIFAGLLVTPHLVALLGIPPDQLFLSFGHPEREAMVRAALLRFDLIFGAALALRVAFDRPILGLRPSIAGDASLVLAAALVVATCAPDAWTLHRTPFAGANLLAVGRVGPATHAFFDANHTPGAWPLASAFGLVVLLVRRPLWTTAMVATGSLMVFVYGGKWDSWSTVVRGSLTAQTVLAIPVGAGLAALAQALGRRVHTAVGVAVAATVVVGAVLPYRSALAWDWSILQELRLLDQAHALHDAGARVHVLSHEDQASTPAPTRFDWYYYRHYAPAWVGSYGAPAPGLDDLIAAPDPVGRMVVLPLTCYRAVFAEPTDGGGRAVWLDGRVYATPPGSATAPGESDLDPATSTLPHALVPCWADRARATCREADPLAPEGCRTWDCPAGVVPEPPDRAYLDPLCAEVRRRFVLAPVVEMDVSAGATGTTLTDVLDPHAVIGLYRVTGEREAEAGLSTGP